jgi:hypothetical protein
VCVCVCVCVCARVKHVHLRRFQACSPFTPLTPAQVLSRFDELFAFFAEPTLIVNLLTAARFQPRLVALDRALRRVMDFF